MGELTLTVHAPDTEACLRALHQWLSAEHGLRGRVRRRHTPPAPGHMGGSADALTVILGSGGIVGLVAPLCAWLTSRRSDVAVTLEADDGRRVTLDVKRATDERAVIREAQEVFRSLAERPEAHPDGQGSGAHPAGRGE
ncbi:hypothetical protein ACGF4C_07235 [Streptomyces sp. NPDC048197]|uniref:effector-associated constant component EACC1 n=1 Tax=Streptomyces sp. NPDC048197 TaxID=3365511 RepID=UPI00371BC66F